MEPETKDIKGEKVRFQMVEHSQNAALEKFILEHFLPDESLAIATGLNDPDPSARMECVRIAQKYAKLAATAQPIASVVAIRESDKEIIGMRLSEVKSLSPKEKDPQTTEYDSRK